jgi:hypothetical protein
MPRREFFVLLAIIAATAVALYAVAALIAAIA